jgi:hypothetical protein
MNEDLAKQRFMVLNLIRISGVVMALFGLLVMVGKIDILPVWSGYILFVVGMIEMLIVPPILARSWKSPPP